MAHVGPPLDRPIEIAALLRPGLETKPDDLALVSAETRWTWRELDQAAGRYGANLLGLGLKPGDRVASLLPNRATLVVHYLGCFRAGLVAVPLNYRYLAGHIDHALQVSGASIMIAHGEREADLAASRLAGQLAHGVVWFRAGDGPGFSVEQLIEATPPKRELAPSDPARPAAIFFTSGSTGPPKGVTHSQESLGWMLASMAEAFELTPSDVMLPGSSISHLGGFMFSLASLGRAVRVVVARTFDGEEILSLLRTTRPSVLCMLPSAFFRLARDHDARREDFASLRLCRGGGDKVSGELEREFTALTGQVIDEGYGMTEVGLAALNPPSGEIKIGSVGRPVPGFTFSIRDEAGRELPQGGEGRLFMKSRSLTLGYWDNAAASQAVIADGWIDSGDIMTADQDGYFWFHGRKKQIIVHDGSNICPQEVEEALLEHGAVESAGAIGVHDLVHGENVRAYITLREGAARPSDQELIRFARARIGYKAPEEIEVLDEMPLNATGKIDRVTLKRMAAEHHAATHREDE